MQRVFHTDNAENGGVPVSQRNNIKNSLHVPGLAGTGADILGELLNCSSPHFRIRASPLPNESGAAPASGRYLFPGEKRGCGKRRYAKGRERERESWREKRVDSRVDIAIFRAGDRRHFVRGIKWLSSIQVLVIYA